MARIFLIIYAALLLVAAFLAIRLGAEKVIGMIRTSEETNVIASNVIAALAITAILAVLFILF